MTAAIVQTGSASTRGGAPGHIARRFFHLSLMLVPFIFYRFLMQVFFPPALHIALIIFLFLVILFEFVRIRLGIVLFAQRLHEATHFSAFGWTMLSLGLVLLFSPSPAYSFAIIISCALADPLLGELRARQVNSRKIISSGLLVVLLVWSVVAYFCHIAYLWALLMAPVTIAVEWPSLKWIDDNALMMLVPLIIVFLVSMHAVI